MLYNIGMKKIFAGAVAALCSLAVAAFGGCGVPNSGVKTYFYMNAPATLNVINMDAQVGSLSETGAAGFDDLADKVDRLLYSTENSISGTFTGSSVYKFNAAAAGTDVEIDKTCYEVLTVAKAIYEQTEGAYNPAVWYCEDLYGFAPRALSDPAMPYDRASTKTLPDQKYIDAFKTLASHFDKVTLREDNGKYYAYKPQETVTVEGDTNAYALRLDLGGIGKGWVVDKISDLMDNCGAKYGYFDFGNSSMALKSFDNNESGEFTLSARDPRNRNAPFVSFQIKDKRLSTSGDYVAYYVVDGVRYCHIIDPATGSPIRTDAASVTVVGGSAAENDAYTTALSAMGKERAVQFINDNLSDRFVIMLFLDGDGGKIITNRPQDVTIDKTEYALANTVSNGKIILN